MKKLARMICSFIIVCAASLFGDSLYTIGHMASPTLDGKLAEGEWSEALRLQGFYRNSNKMLLGTERCYTYIGTDGKTLFIAVSTTTGDEAVGGGLFTRALTRDSAVYKDDSVEILLSADNKTLYHYVVNSAGAIYDAQLLGPNHNVAWNGNLATANLNESGRWVVECAIPLSDLKITDFQELKINVCRNWKKHGPSTAFASSGYHDLQKLKFLPDAPVYQENILEGLDSGSFVAGFKINPRGRELELKTVINGEGKEIYSVAPRFWTVKPQGSCIFHPGDKRNHIVLNPEEGGKVDLYSMQFAAGPGDKVKVDFEASGSSVIAGLLLYDANMKYLAAIKPPEIKLSRDWKEYTANIEVPANVRSEKKPCAFVKLLFMTKQEALALRNVKASVNDKNMDLNGSFARYRITGTRIANSEKIKKDGDFQINSSLKGGINTYSADILLAGKGEEFIRRSYRFGTGSGLVEKSLHPAIYKEVLGEGFLVAGRIYPGTKRFVFELIAEKEVNIKNARAFLTDGNKTYSADFLSAGKNRWTASMDFPEKSGVWTSRLVVRDSSGKSLLPEKTLFEFTARSFPWEDNELGKDDILIPPFTPIQVNDNEVSLLLRKYSMNNLGFLDQISSMEQNILSSPMTLEATVNGKNISWKSSPLSYPVKTPTKAVAQSFSSSGEGINYQSNVTFDYDGFLWVKGAVFAEKKTVLDRLTLRFGIKKEFAKLLHSVADQIRTNPSIAVPEGKGEVWSSSKVDRKVVGGRIPMRDGLTAYLWIGDEMRGLCWALDSGAGFKLAKNDPQIKVLRKENGDVEVQIDIVSTPVEVTSTKREFEFGLQATPVKLRPKDYRNWSFRTVPGMFNIYFPMHKLLQGKFGFQAEPINKDYALLKGFSRAFIEKKWDPAVLAEFNKHHARDFNAIVSKHNTMLLRDYSHHLRPGENIEQLLARWRNSYAEAASKRLLLSDRAIPYYDPKLNFLDDPETQYYASEWTGPQGLAYGPHYRTFMVKSHIDYRLFVFKNYIEAGFGSIYLDDLFLHTGFDPDAGQSVVDADGVVHPKTGMLGMRELVRRLAVLQHKMNISPRLTTIHATNGFFIPMFSFADVVYGWEAQYGQKPFQERFSSEYIRTESTGLQAGLVSTVLGGIRIPGILSPAEATKLRNDLTRSLLAWTIVHDIQPNDDRPNQEMLIKNRAILRDFGIAFDDCQFIPYWVQDSRFPSSNGILISFYERKGKILLILANSKQEEQQITLKAPDIKSVFRDAESDLPVKMPVTVKGYDFRLILLENED